MQCIEPNRVAFVTNGVLNQVTIPVAGARSGTALDCLQKKPYFHYYNSPWKLLIKIAPKAWIVICGELLFRRWYQENFALQNIGIAKAQFYQQKAQFNKMWKCSLYTCITMWWSWLHSVARCTKHNSYYYYNNNSSSY